MDDWTNELLPRPGHLARARVPIPAHQAGRAGCPDTAIRRRNLRESTLFLPPNLLAVRRCFRAGNRLFNLGVAVKDEAPSWSEQAARLESSGAAARASSDERNAETHFRQGLDLALKAAGAAAQSFSPPARRDALLLAARLSLNLGEAAEARRLISEALEIDPIVASAGEWEQLRDVSAWPDSWLVAAVRREPPDAPALDALAERYWKSLFGRCYLLTLDQDKAGDLAQQAWCRVLRARQRLNPAGNFPGYLATVATNLWRDSHRHERRAGPMADHKLASLDQPLSLEEGENVLLADVLPDLNSLQPEEQTLLKLDLDQALERLTPLLRDVLIARFITGESCAEIGSRHGRTEQTVSGWVRQAIREIKVHLEAPAARTVQTNES